MGPALIIAGVILVMLALFVSGRWRWRVRADVEEALRNGDRRFVALMISGGEIVYPQVEETLDEYLKSNGICVRPVGKGHELNGGT